ncbi:hypothetical protein FOMG_16890 [Fusarium oxysporum f. sp. melonis 26406]|uniref:Uncharacterized protein n=1 Tax=Fusarium oxysporum f. sp. melonis 26406 TaxID=1089452 RepID=W9ZDE6_FUSOX|nr:hypothetical protein FOMG_16890 [Fusarium oxysporum f. sp. melonis 26406]
MPSLFFNADLMQTQIDGNGGAIAFVGAYIAWVSGPMAQSNRGGIQAIIDKALDWERRSGVTVEVEKMAIMHFTRYTGRIDSELFTIKGEMVVPRDQVKVLGVIMDMRLHCKQNIAFYSHRSSSGAVVEDASNVWMYGCNTVSSYAIH